ncbi:MAG: hypothetical protein RL098_211 [Bacteroidota bacterium]
MKITTLFCSLVCSLLVFAQKPTLDFNAYDTWKRLEKEQISSNGKIITYELTVLQGNPILHIFFSANAKHDSILRGNNALIASDESFVAWKMSPEMGQRFAVHLAPGTRQHLQICQTQASSTSRKCASTGLFTRSEPQKSGEGGTQKDRKMAFLEKTCAGASHQSLQN